MIIDWAAVSQQFLASLLTLATGAVLIWLGNYLSKRRQEESSAPKLRIRAGYEWNHREDPNEEPKNVRHIGETTTWEAEGWYFFEMRVAIANSGRPVTITELGIDLIKDGKRGVGVGAMRAFGDIQLPMRLEQGQLVVLSHAPERNDSSADIYNFAKRKGYEIADIWIMDGEGRIHRVDEWVYLHDLY